MVWTITKDAKKKQLRPVGSDCFWRDYFYDLISASGERCQSLENILGRIESGVAKTVEHRVLQRQPLDQTEAENLDLFVACMFMRTEKMRDCIMSAVSAGARIERDHAACHREPVPDTSVYEDNAHAHAIYDGILFVSDELKTMSHNIFIAPLGRDYVTSDTPCIWQAPIGPMGLINPTLEITLPLSPKHLLHITNAIPTSDYIEAQAFSVEQANWDMIQRCRRYFIANSQTIYPTWLDSGLHRLNKLVEGALALG
jgi:hypothetical protein